MLSNLVANNEQKNPALARLGIIACLLCSSWPWRDAPKRGARRQDRSQSLLETRPELEQVKPSNEPGAEKAPASKSKITFLDGLAMQRMDALICETVKRETRSGRAKVSSV
jgi:hypothetical protein